MSECREPGCSRIEMLLRNYLNDRETPDPVLRHDVQNIDETRRRLAVEEAPLRFVLQLEF